VSDNWRERLTGKLESVLSLPDPRKQIGPYREMPYAIFRYAPEDEFAVRKEVTNLEIRLTGRGKRIHRISLADCLHQAMFAERPLEEWVEAEKEQGIRSVVETVNEILAHDQPLVDLVAERLPQDRDPHRDIVFIVRVAALFPMYRTFSLLEQLKGRLDVPAILFYPGTADGPAGLRFMGVMEAEHNYRPTIF
jgi:Domain of unknown function (DUF1788)